MAAKVPVTSPAAAASMKVPTMQKLTAAWRRAGSSRAFAISRARTQGTDAAAMVPQTRSSDEAAPTTAYCLGGSSQTSTAV
jgi:hypothetical protein